MFASTINTVCIWYVDHSSCTTYICGIQVVLNTCRSKWHLKSYHFHYTWCYFLCVLKGTTVSHRAGQEAFLMHGWKEIRIKILYFYLALQVLTFILSWKRSPLPCNKHALRVHRIRRIAFKLKRAWISELLEALCYIIYHIQPLFLLSLLHLALIADISVWRIGTCWLNHTDGIIFLPVNGTIHGSLCYWEMLKCALFVYHCPLDWSQLYNISLIEFQQIKPI